MPSTEEYTERNKAIFAARKSGETYRSLGVRYGVTSSRIMEICKREERRERKRKETEEKIKADQARLEANDYFIEELFPEDNSINSRIQHSLRRMGIDRLSDLATYLYACDTTDCFHGVIGYKRLLRIRNLGQKSIDRIAARLKSVAEEANHAK